LTSSTTSIQATNVSNIGHNNFITSSDIYSYDWIKGADSDGNIRNSNWSKIDGSSVCPIGYRVPTESELQAETTDKDIYNNISAFENFLKLPSNGTRHFNGLKDNPDNNWGRIWSSTQINGYAKGLTININNAYWFNDYRSGGFSVRCIKEN